MFIKTGDTVVLLTGDYKDKKTDKGEVKTGKVIATSPKEGKVIVQGMNIVSKHQKARKQGEQSKILEVESAVYACKVQLYCSNCKAGRRVGFKFVEDKNGNKNKVRYCRKCGEEI